MSSAEASELIKVSKGDFIDDGAAIEIWQRLPASVISHHGSQCCQVAREWILSMDYSQLNAADVLTGPRWLRQKYTWGPSSWPIHWCEAVERKTLDCGALAAMAQEVFAARGIRSFPVQLIQQYTEDATRHWCKRWESDESSMHWIRQNLIYHEACAVVARDDEMKIWDSSAGWWIKPEQSGGYGGLIALRVLATRADPSVNFKWGAHRIVPNQWQKIAKA